MITIKPFQNVSRCQIVVLCIETWPDGEKTDVLRSCREWLDSCSLLVLTVVLLFVFPVCWVGLGIFLCKTNLELLALGQGFGAGCWLKENCHSSLVQVASLSLEEQPSHLQFCTLLCVQVYLTFKSLHLYLHYTVQLCSKRQICPSGLGLCIRQFKHQT